MAIAATTLTIKVDTSPFEAAVANLVAYLNRPEVHMLVAHLKRIEQRKRASAVHRAYRQRRRNHW